MKKNNWYKRIFYFFFLMYIFVFILDKSGYYEKTLRDKRIMTEEKIKQFEKDVSDNKAVSLIDYLPEEKDYSNFITKSATKVSNRLAIIFDEKIDSFWDFIKALFIG